MKIKDILSSCKCLVIFISVLYIGTVVYVEGVRAESSIIIVTQNSHGINVTLSGRFELFFNATNGGEITRYYDLVADPSRSNNLVLPASESYQPPIPYDMWPLFSSAFYKKSTKVIASTGRDGTATVIVLGHSTDYVIVQTKSRVMTPSGWVFKDVNGNVNYVNSTWLIRNDGYIFLERTLYTPTVSVIPREYRWYPFYSVRTKGFADEATFYIFNTTYAYTYTVSQETYQNDYAVFPPFPADNNSVFGVASPFSNTTLGGDGTNNMILVYEISESLKEIEWKADNYNGRYGTEFGATHEFDADSYMGTHTYHAMIVLTHEPVSQQNAMIFADYFSKNPVFPLLEADLATDKIEYAPGDLFNLYASGTAYCDMTLLTSTVTITNSTGSMIWYKNYGTYNYSQDQTWADILLLSRTIPQGIPTDNYTITLWYISSIGIVITSSSETILVTPADAHSVSLFARTRIERDNQRIIS